MKGLICLIFLVAGPLHAGETATAAAGLDACVEQQTRETPNAEWDRILGPISCFEQAACQIAEVNRAVLPAVVVVPL